MAVETKVAPEFLYYLLLDGTPEVDSVGFASNLTPKKGFGGWRNLVDFLQPDPFDETHLTDGAHIYLPVIRFDGSGKESKGGTAVVCPGGKWGIGREDMWRSYDPAPRKWPFSIGSLKLDFETVGRHTAAEESARMAEAFLLNPAVQVDSFGVGSIVAERPLKSGATVFRASLMYVSSHGWLGGFMRGNGIAQWDAADPKDAREPYVPQIPYFLVGRVDRSGKGFAGPVWIVLAQCSTLNSATWAMWARVMANSTPPVHGILGYEEASPAADQATSIANRFFGELRNKQPFLDAWKTANSGQHWAAIVHKDAHKDSMVAFPRNRLAKPTLSDYIGYLPSIRGGAPVSDPAPPFHAQLFRVRNYGVHDHAPPDAEEPVEVTPDTLDGMQSHWGANSWYLVRFAADQAFDRATIRLFHIRRSFALQFRHAQLFASVECRTSGGTIDLSNRNEVTVKFSTPVKQAEIFLRSQTPAALAGIGLEAHHSYLWLHARVHPAGGAELSHDFLTLGLSWYG